MKRILPLLCALLLACSCATAQEQTAPTLEGVRLYPEGATEETARYRFAYRYPQLAATDGIAADVNAHYQAVLQEMLDAVMPQEYEALALEGIPDGPGCYASVEYAIRLDNEDYLSIVLTTTQFLGNNVAQSVSADVFARQGEYQGMPCTLSQVVGLEGDTPAQGSSYASQLAYGLVWQIIAEQQSVGQIDYLEGLSRESVARAFQPETDFYLDEDGNLVFFIQAGLVAGEVEGVLTYPFAVAEFLSAVRE